jgi:glycosyltransferase involved in cell wall biosynthesis
MTEHIPQVSVLVPTYNRRQLIQDTIASILAQTFQDFEIIVTDNCSTDDTEQVVAAINDPRVVYVKNDVNIGPVNNYNKALRLAKGKYVYVFSDDDTMVPENLELRVAVMEQYPSVGLVHSNINVIDGNGTITETNHWAARHPGMAKMWQEIVSKPLMDKSRAFHYLYYNWNFVSMPAVLMRRELLLKYGLEFNNQLRYICDWDLWMRVALFGDFYFIDKPLVSYRLHASNDAKTLTAKLYLREIVVSKLGMVNLFNRLDLHKKNYLTDIVRLAKRQLVYAGENETFFQEKSQVLRSYLKKNLSPSSLDWLKKMRK